MKQRKMMRIDSKDPAFRITDGLAVYARAALEIERDCPSDVIYLYQQGIERGWIKLVAYVPEDQYAWEKLKQE